MRLASEGRELAEGRTTPTLYDVIEPERNHHSIFHNEIELLIDRLD